MKLYDNGEANIHLVACVPRLVYDHRIIVTGELVGVK
jgi:sortase (surface protein transpeptidase)